MVPSARVLVEVGGRELFEQQLDIVPATRYLAKQTEAVGLAPLDTRQGEFKHSPVESQGEKFRGRKIGIGDI
jgi:hypothetical protein